MIIPVCCMSRVGRLLFRSSRRAVCMPPSFGIGIRGYRTSALCQIITDQGEKADKQKMLSYGRGCVLNFLSAATPDGEIPIQIRADLKSSSLAAQPNPASNMHKPVLAQHAAFLVKLDNGNAEWLREKFDVLQAFEKTIANISFTNPPGCISGKMIWPLA